MREAILQDPNAESKSVREGRLPRRNKLRKRCTRRIQRTKSGSDLTLLTPLGRRKKGLGGVRV